MGIGGINPLDPLLGRSDSLLPPPSLGTFRAIYLNPRDREGHGNLLTNENGVMSTTIVYGVALGRVDGSDGETDGRQCVAGALVGRVDGSNGRRVPDVSACSMVAAFATSRRDGRAAGRGGCGRLAVPIDQTGGDAARDRSGGGAGVTVWHGAACSMVAAMLRGVPSGGRAWPLASSGGGAARGSERRGVGLDYMRVAAKSVKRR